MNALEFRVEMLKLPPPPDGSNPPHWLYWRNDLYQRAISDEDPNGFFDWPCIFHTMLVNHWSEYVTNEHDELPMRYRVNATLTNVPFYPLDLMNGSDMSLNFIHQLYHLWRFSQVTGMRVDQMDTIVEFGGGYGAMRLMVHRMGFRGRYYIFDLPEFLLLQRFFLSKFDIGSTDFCEDIYKLPNSADMLIACYSISESSLDLRDRFLAHTSYKNFLFLSSEKFAGYDNSDYFSSLWHTDSDSHRWYWIPIRHLPEGSFYLFGQGK